MQHERVSAQQAGREIRFRDTIFEREKEEEEEEGNQRKFETLRKKSTSKLAQENGLLLFCSVSAVLIFNFEAAHNQPVFFSPNGGGETPKIIWVREREREMLSKSKAHSFPPFLSFTPLAIARFPWAVS